MLNKIKTYCRQKELLQQGDRVLLGISGGADSVCLLFVLLALAGEWGLSLVPVHVNHHLRGEEADADEAFCRELCEKQGLSLLAVHADVRKLAKEHAWSLEEAGRNARYQAFYRIAEENGCQKIAVAHHRNDQAETVLFQLFRGSRLSGLAGMEAKAGCLIRPMLAVSKEEIETYIQQLGIGWRIDSTNLNGDFTRNRIRHKLLPEAEKISGGAVRHIAETADYLRRVEQFVGKEAEKLYRQVVTGQSVSVSGLAEADSLLAEQVIYRVICEVAGQKKDIVSEHVAACLDLSEKQTGRSICLPYGVTVTKSYGNLVFSKGKQPAKNSFFCKIESFPARVQLPKEQCGGIWICLKLEELGCDTKKYIEKSGGIPKCTYTKWFDYDKISDIISLRLPNKEDTIALYADGRGKPLLQFLADEKIGEAERKSVVILAEGSRVLWIPGIRGSEAYRVTEHTRRILTAPIHGGKSDGTQD